MENPINIDDLGVPLFLETPICWIMSWLIQRHQNYLYLKLTAKAPENWWLERLVYIFGMNWSKGEVLHLLLGRYTTMVSLMEMVDP